MMKLIFVNKILLVVCVVNYVVGTYVPKINVLFDSYVNAVVMEFEANKPHKVQQNESSQSYLPN